MNRTEYKELYNDHKQGLKAAIRKWGEENPERFAELQERAKYELEHPLERPIVRHTIGSFDVDVFIRQHHTQSYYIHTKDAFGDTHLYFESLGGEIAEKVLVRRHPKFIERSEKVTEVEKCQCPLCQSLN